MPLKKNIKLVIWDEKVLAIGESEVKVELFRVIDKLNFRGIVSIIVCDDPQKSIHLLENNKLQDFPVSVRHKDYSNSVLFVLLEELTKIKMSNMLYVCDENGCFDNLPTLYDKINVSTSTQIVEELDNRYLKGNDDAKLKNYNKYRMLFHYEPIKVYQFDIWGCCVSRDVFGISKDGGLGIQLPKGTFQTRDCEKFHYVINNFFQGCSAKVQFSDKVGPDYDIEELSSITHQHIKKSMLADLNRTITHALDDSPSDWIIVDLRSETYAQWLITYSNKSQELATAHEVDKFKRALDSKNCVSSYSVISNTFQFENKWVDLLSDYLVRRYGNNIILIDVMEAPDSLGRFGGSEISTDYTHNSDASCEEIRTLEMMLNARFIENTGCYVVKCPFNIISDDLQKWGRDGVHYIDEYYTYALNSIYTIVSEKNNIDIYSKLETQYYYCCAKLNQIRSSNEKSINNSLKRAELLINQNNLDKAIELVQPFLDKSEPRCCRLIGSAYREGKRVPRDLHKASYYYSKIIDSDAEWALGEYLDILWDMNTPEADSKLFLIANRNVDSPNPVISGNCLVRIGRAYRDGRGTSQDINLACIFFTKSIQIVKWTIPEYLDVLWRVNSKETDI